MRRPATLLAILALVIAGGGLYATGLGDVPVYVMHDEAQGALQAQSIASTGRDLTGRLLPLYFTEPEFPPGRDPALIYFTALVLKVVPFTEADPPPTGSTSVHRECRAVALKSSDVNDNMRRDSSGSRTRWLP